MSQHRVDFDEDAARKSYGRPYGAKHPIPTIQGYREHRAELDQRLKQTEEAQSDEEGDSRLRRAYDSVKTIAKNEDDTNDEHKHDPYPSSNRNILNRPKRDRNDPDPVFKQVDAEAASDRDGDRSGSQSQSQDQNSKSATEMASGHIDPKQKRKDMKKIKRTGGGREVTDPVTHLPVVIHDLTDKDLNSTRGNEPAPGTQPRNYTGMSGASKSEKQLNAETEESQRGYMSMQGLFPPPDFEDTKKEIARTYQLALTAGIGSIAALAVLGIGFVQIMSARAHRTMSSADRRPGYSTWTFPWFSVLFTITAVSAAAVGLTTTISGWLRKKVEDIWDDETWDASRHQEQETNASDEEYPESVAWLNSTLSSVWPLINPDLFASVIDMLEDVMQASLPKLVRMVSVDDLGQGSESVRILGIRWLPTGAASQSVDADGSLKPAKENSQNDRVAPDRGETDGKAGANFDDQNQGTENGGQEGQAAAHKKETDQQKKQREQEQQAMREGMEAEEGDFVNMELAFAYRARSSGKSIKSKARNAHLYLKFYLPGGIAIPVWVELRGIVGTMRVRLQLTPDPPFFSLCTFTFLGQPRANLSCVPLSRKNLNLMDVPLISSFVQSAIDAALAEYVAPKSMTLDLKDMLIGDDFKKDTVTRGVVLIFIKKARDFKEGDGGIGPMRGSSDSYVTVSWGKFGKPVASTRIITNSQEPTWNEWASILVTPDELNAEEKLRLQLWDSDKMTADDDLGRVEVDLKELIGSVDTHNKMCDRTDDFTGEDPDEKMPGRLEWSVGYYAKTRIQPCQFEKQDVNTQIRSKEDLKKAVSEMSERKLREATAHDETKELRQQKVQDYKEQEDAMIISAPPPDDFPSGILSIQIHNITGLEIQTLNKKDQEGGEVDLEDQSEGAENLPDSYCTIMLNHTKIYRTRTKPKNGKPFFNAGTERFVRDWRTTEIMISIRDSREHEDDALLGVVYLPLDKVFRKRTQVNGNYPLAGGVGYGRARISMVWRSIDLSMPKELIGWDYGTLEVKVPIRMKSGGHMFDELKSNRIKLRTNLGKAKMYPPGWHGHGGHSDTEGGTEWRPKSKNSDDAVFLAVRRRYASALMVEFRKSSFGPDTTAAFAVLWLHDIADEEEKTVSLKVWEGGKENIKRAESSCEYEGPKDGEQPMGELELTLKFWRGLSGYHKHYAQKSANGDVRSVMEVLDTVNDEKMNQDDDERSIGDSDSSDSDSDVKSVRSISRNKDESPEDARTRAKLRTHVNQDASDQDADNGDSTASAIKHPLEKIKGAASSILNGGKDDTSDDGTRGLRGQIKDYKDHHKQLHRQHRGVMQWKSARTLDWMVGKVKRGKGRVGEVFEHSEKDQGIETEV